MENAAFESAFNEIGKLAAKFKKHYAHYIAPGYSEAQARKDFIDKFFVALGWDVNNDSHPNPYEQEVKVERTVSVGPASRHADYAFVPNYRDVQFVCEAKKPAGEIATADNYFQAIRYGWNLGNPLSTLTTFEQFHLLDCRYKPDINAVLHLCVEKWELEDYRDRDKFARLYWLVSREAVLGGSLEKRAADLPTPRGGARQRKLLPGGGQPIGETFLQELDGYRLTLARAFKSKHPELDSDVLTEATQRALDRLVFMRFLEDKLIEPSRFVENFGHNRTAWQDFANQSRRLNTTYNGIVFKIHDLLDSQGFRPDDAPFAKICEELSHKNSPYDFNTIPVHILGSIYERFLGNVIVATDKRVSIQEKPEVRHAGGVYYTPEYIVRYIVQNTVGRLIQGKTPAEISEMRFADIACGSGSFLIDVYDLLIRHHAKYYNDNLKKAPKGDVVARDGILRLSLPKKRDILLRNIYGMDVDPQAVEVTQLSLYLKLLEDETVASTHGEFQRRMATVLPSLSSNIICGNSLVETDAYDATLFQLRGDMKLNPISFDEAFPEVTKAGGFDAILGNPPYIDSETMTLHLKDEREYCSRRYDSASGNWDLFCVFVERTLQKLRPGGLASLIVPNKLGAADYSAGARRSIDRNRLISVRDYSAVQVFPVAVYPIVYCAQKATRRSTATVLYERMKPTDRPIPDIELEERLSYDGYFSDPSRPWRIFSSIKDSALASRLSRDFPALGECAKVLGAATVSEAYSLKPLISDDNDSSLPAFKLINSGTIDRYRILWGHQKTRYIKQSYLHPVVGRAILKRRFPRRFDQASEPKVVIAGMTLKLEAAIDVNGDYLAGKSTTIVLSPLDVRVLGAILNSRLINYWFIREYGGNRLGGGYLRIGPPQIKNIPYRNLDLSQKPDQKLYVRIIEQVDALLNLAPSTSKTFRLQTDYAKAQLARQVEVVEHRIDALVYELYGLTNEEIAVVEAGQ